MIEGVSVFDEKAEGFPISETKKVLNEAAPINFFEYCWKA